MFDKNSRIINDGEISQKEKEEMYAEFLVKEEKRIKFGKKVLYFSIALIIINTIFCFLRDYSLMFGLIKEMFFEDPNDYYINFIIPAFLAPVSILHIALSILTVVTSVTKKFTRAVLIVSASFIGAWDLLTASVLFSSSSVFESGYSLTVAVFDAIFLIAMGSILYFSIAKDDVAKYIYEKRKF